MLVSVASLLLLGDVTVTVHNWELSIIGSPGADRIGYEAGELLPRPGTTINGLSEPVPLPSFRSIYIDMGGGDDEVIFAGVGVDYIHADLGDGDDVFAALDSGIGELRAHLGAGGDSATLEDAVLDSALITGGSGSDHVWLTHCDLDGSVSVRLGTGNDTLTANWISFQSAKFHGGSGVDVLEGNASGAKVRCFESR